MQLPKPSSGRSRQLINEQGERAGVQARLPHVWDLLLALHRHRYKAPPIKRLMRPTAFSLDFFFQAKQQPMGKYSATSDTFMLFIFYV